MSYLEKKAIATICFTFKTNVLQPVCLKMLNCYRSYKSTPHTIYLRPTNSYKSDKGVVKNSKKKNIFMATGRGVIEALLFATSPC